MTDAEYTASARHDEGFYGPVTPEPRSELFYARRALAVERERVRLAAFILTGRIL